MYCKCTTFLLAICERILSVKHQIFPASLDGLHNPVDDFVKGAI